MSEETTPGDGEQPSPQTVEERLDALTTETEELRSKVGALEAQLPAAAAVKDGAAEVRQNDEGDYEVGATLEGVWVRFVTKTGSYVDHLVAAARLRSQDDKQP